MDVIFSSLYHCHRFQVHFSGVVPAMTNQVSAGSQPLSRHNLPVVAIPNAATTIVISITHYRCHQADGEAPESLLLSSNILLPMQPMTMVVSNAVYLLYIGIVWWAITMVMTHYHCHSSCTWLPVTRQGLTIKSLPLSLQKGTFLNCHYRCRPCTLLPVVTVR